MKRRQAKPIVAAIAEPSFASPVTRREMSLFASVLLAAVILRLLALTGSAVEHFDEGVYASNIYFGPPDYAYPLQRFYAPPLLPALIEAGMIAGLSPNVAALAPSFLAGCGTIAALWWFGRFWFGPSVGIAAATLAALSPFHVAYSATALTDVLLGLWLILAVDAIGRSIIGGDLRWAVGAGLYTGAAWWTKHNGWLPLAIEAVALPLLWLWLRPARREWMTWLTCLGVTALVAAAVWGPYYWSLRFHGGYGPIAANHAKYVVGLSGWLNAASRQIANQYVMEGLAAAIALIAAFSLPALLVRRSPRELFSICWGNVGLGLLAVFQTTLLLAIAGAVLACSRILFAVHQAQRQDATWKRRAIGMGLVATWLGGMIVATPGYTPYPRLVLPLFAAAWLGLAMNAAEFLSPILEPAQPLTGDSWRRQALGCLFLGSVFVGPCLVGNFLSVHSLPSDRRGVLRVAEQVVRDTAAEQPRALYVYGEPALFFQLRAAGEPTVMPIQDVPSQAATLEGQRIATYLIVGPHSDRDLQFQTQWAAAEPRWELVTTFAYTPSAIVWLDLHDPRWRADESAVHKFRVFRLRL
jgi:dolichyl-phosphate-mannose-protein mannosyltransferase